MVKTYEEVMELVGKVAEVSAENTQSTAVVLARLEQQGTLLAGLSKSVTAVKDDVATLSNDMEQLKLNEEVTTTQQETITVKLLATMNWNRKNIFVFLYKNYIKIQDKMPDQDRKYQEQEKVISRDVSITQKHGFLVVDVLN